HDVVEPALILCGLLAMAVLLPHHLVADGARRYEALSQLLGQGRISPLNYSLLGPLFSAPLWLLGHATANPVGWVLQFNLICLALCLLVLYLLLRPHVDRRVLGAFLLLLVAASMFPDHVRYYYGEVFTVACVGAGLAAVVFGGRRTRLVGWAAIVVGTANIPPALVGLAAVTLVRLIQQKRLREILPLLSAVALVLAENWIRRGGPLNQGYDDNHGVQTIMPYAGLPGFSYPFFFGLLAILLSFGKGLIFYTPGMFLPMRRALATLRATATRQADTLYLLWLSFVIGLIVIYAKWWSWYGGWFWGPRFFLFASLPASFVLAARLHARGIPLVGNLLTLGALALSFWVGVDGAIFGQNTLSEVCFANNYSQEFLCHFTLEFSALWRPFVAYEPLNTADVIYVAYSAIVFVYLVLPLLGRILEQGRELTQRLWRTHLNLADWHI
ncbi:MAG TPA: hypothetical protein VGP82_20565, partial [Ktedonobacterales bacterium]|nr:hypothetical protein [Ktedonobacterales bacterium]